MRRWMEASPGSKRIDITPCSMDIMPEPVLRYTSGCISPFGDPIMSFQLGEDALGALLLLGMRHAGHPPSEEAGNAWPCRRACRMRAGVHNECWK